MGMSRKILRHLWRDKINRTALIQLMIPCCLKYRVVPQCRSRSMYGDELA